MSETPAKGSAPVRTVITLLMDVLIGVAIVLVAHMVIVFFGQIAAQPWAKSVVDLTRRIVAPLGVAGIKTPYGGIFDVDAAGTIFIVLGIEWVLGVVRRSV
jgi:hypothetical protein